MVFHFIPGGDQRPHRDQAGNFHDAVIIHILGKYIVIAEGLHCLQQGTHHRDFPEPFILQHHDITPGSRVKSPTYTIVNEYRRGEIPLFHFDLYRIEDPDDLDGFGFDEYVSTGSCITEWSENIPFALPKSRTNITIEKTDNGDGRRITIEEL